MNLLSTYRTYGIIFLLFFGLEGMGQNFTRSQLPSPLQTPWEITYGPDGMLWITEEGGKVSRMDPLTGGKTVVYEAPDYFGGDMSEEAPCGRPIGAHTYGLALHPDFLDSASVYFMYAYNQGSANTPQTRFKIVELTWDSSAQMISQAHDLITNLPNGYDHWGGRLLATKESGTNYLYFSMGDLGSTDETCYPTGTTNPNTQAQDPFTANGKIHRVLMDGSIPTDNPISGNSFFTRGHRNPQGLAFNPNQEIVYDIEHGDKTDDEVNVLYKGMNYGWKEVSGFHDGNYPGELDYIANYLPNNSIPNDSLVQPLYAWGVENQPEGGFLDWPTIAPSDGIYYGSDGIPEWTHSLLVVSLKDGSQTDQEVFQLKLNSDGKTLIPDTPAEPNPRTFFGEDQALNGRLRDITFSPDGKTIFLITNNWGVDDYVIMYTYEPDSTGTTSIFSPQEPDRSLADFSPLAPNPFTRQTSMTYSLKQANKLSIYLTNLEGKVIRNLYEGIQQAGTHSLNWNGQSDQGTQAASGMYYLHVYLDNQFFYSQKVVFMK
ncbi:MAG: PQQ-dependent sugar dehydrogenase [Bacteroidota bacterium]